MLNKVFEASVLTVDVVVPNELNTEDADEDVTNGLNEKSSFVPVVVVTTEVLIGVLLVMDPNPKVGVFAMPPIAIP